MTPVLFLIFGPPVEEQQQSLSPDASKASMHKATSVRRGTGFVHMAQSNYNQSKKGAYGAAKRQAKTSETSDEEEPFVHAII